MTTTPQQDWQQAILAYADTINTYIARGLTEGWDNLEAPDDMADVSATIPAFLAALHQANAAPRTAEAIAAFRAQWLPSTTALQKYFSKKENTQGFCALAWLPDDRLLVRVGHWYEDGSHTVLIDGEHVTPLPDVELFGLSPCGRYLAVLHQGQIAVHDGFGGPVVARFAMPRGDEDPPAGIQLVVEEDYPIDPISLTPFDHGQRLLVAHSGGVHVLDAQGTHRLLPTDSDLQEWFNYVKEKKDFEGSITPEADMVHAAVSPDGRWIAAGTQSSGHHVFDAATLQPVSCIGPHGEYPHHAAFFADSAHAAFNACHFYNGGTIGVAVEDFAQLDGTDYYEEHPAITVLQDGARVYCSAAVGELLIIGDAYGHLYAVDATGKEHWRMYLGSTLSAMAASPDGTRLAVGSYSGIVHLIELDSTRPHWQIGTGNQHEYRRWLFWTDQKQALAW